MKLKSCNQSKRECFWVIFNFGFMQDPQIAPFYLAIMEMHPFYGLLTGPLGLRAASNQKAAKNQKVMYLGRL